MSGKVVILIRTKVEIAAKELVDNLQIGRIVVADVGDVLARAVGAALSGGWILFVIDRIVLTIAHRS
jgi:hypothetical protein